MTKTILLIVALLASPALAEESYSRDDLCRAIGRTSNVAVQPRDRLFFEKNCVCFTRLDTCLAKGSKEAKIHAQVEWDLRESDIGAARKAVEEAKAAYDACRSRGGSITPPCRADFEELQAARARLLEEEAR